MKWRGFTMMKMLLTMVAAAFAIGLAAAGPANADEDSYLTDLANNDFTGQSSTALKMGYTICTDVKHGVPEGTTVAAIYENTADSVTEDDARYIYEAALIHLC
jgi:hypothetical protein